MGELTNILEWADKPTEALEYAEELAKNEFLDGLAIYNLGCVFARQQQNNRAIELLKRSIHSGYKDIDTFQRDPDLAQIRLMPEFSDLMSLLIM